MVRLLRRRGYLGSGNDGIRVTHPILQFLQWMRRFFIMVIFLLSVDMDAVGMGLKQAPFIVTSISEQHEGIIRRALDCLHNRKLRVEKYDIVLLEAEDEWVVVFRSKTIPDGYRGSPPGAPGYEVTLEKTDLTIKQEQFSR